MLFYLIFTALIIFLVSPLAGKYDINTRLSLAMLVIMVVSIFRFDVGYDYPYYYYAAYVPRFMDMFEPVSRLFGAISRWTGSNYTFIMLHTFFTYLFVFIAIRRHSSNPAVSLVTYLLLCWIFPLGYIRQGLAMAVIFWGFKYVESRSFWKYLIVCIAAMMCHASAVIGILFYFIYWYIKFGPMVVFTLSLTVLLPLLLNIIANVGFYSSYIGMEFGTGGGAVERYFGLLFYIFSLVLYKLSGRRVSDNKYFIVIMPSIVIPFLIYPLYAQRVTPYFMLFYCFLAPDLFKGQKYNIKTLYISVMYLYFIGYIWVDSVSGSRSALTPYRTIFNVEQPVTFKGH